MIDPHALFADWYAEARAAEPDVPDAMALATVDPDGRPAMRMVLLKGHDARGFVFYTNPHASLLFHWKSLHRQIRIEGAIERVTEAEGDAYFASRSRDSQLGAWASDQSRPLDSRATLEARYEAMRARFADGPVPRPPHWSGFRVIPDRIEYWQDRAHRLHERRLFIREGEGWTEGLLYP